MKLRGLLMGLLLAAGCATVQEKQTSVAPNPNGRVITRTASATAGVGVDAYAIGRVAAERLKARLDGVEPQVVILTECFADKADKAKVAKGVASVFGKECVVGISSYGFYTRDGVADRDAVALLALGGDGLGVRMAFVPKQNSVGLTMENDEAKLKAALGEAGRKLAEQLPVYDQSRLMIVLADTHSPKNQLLLDGIQSVVGTKFPVTGGSANKNAGQNWIHWKGGLYSDAALALMIDGNTAIVQNGAQAKDNDAVLATAKTVAQKLTGAPFATWSDGGPRGLVLAFDCAGRKGKLDDIEEEQKAIIAGLNERTDSGGARIPARLGGAEIFGMWCAGEIGCPEDSLEQPVGRGWHIMATALGANLMPPLSFPQPPPPGLRRAAPSPSE